MAGQREREMILIPLQPTPEMIDAARESALAEDAGAVWQAMIEEYKRLCEQRELGQR